MKTADIAWSFGITVALLLVLALANWQFDAVTWGVADFAAAGFILLGVCVFIRLSWTRTRGIVRGMGVVTCLGLGALVWVELAVGLFTKLGS